MRIGILVLIFGLLTINLSAQYILNNNQGLEQIETGLNNLYNFNFQNSDSLYNKISDTYPNHPFPLLYDALTIYMKHFPITPNSEFHELYVNKITQSIEKTDSLLKEDKKNSELIFLGLMGRLLIMQYYADNEMSSKVIPYMQSAYKLTKKGFKLSEEVIDFNFSTGMYNYYREAYPEKYPVYKPIAFFFPDGDKQKGIAQLEYNSHNGIFLDAEALAFLVYISLYFEGNPQKANKYTKQLYKKYPNNPLYTSYRIQALLLQNKYNKAIPIIQILKEHMHSNDYFDMMALVYSGVIEEKLNKNLPQAQFLYQTAITKSEKYGRFGKRSAAYAYIGLLRINKSKNKELSSSYHSKAVDQASYPALTFQH